MYYFVVFPFVYIFYCILIPTNKNELFSIVGTVPAQSLRRCIEFEHQQTQPIEVKEFDLADHMVILKFRFFVIFFIFFLNIFFVKFFRKSKKKQKINKRTSEIKVEKKK